MTPFRIQCETCKTTLRVRNPGFIGQVHGCPQCGSMVMIAPPASSGETAEEPAAEATSDAAPLAPVKLALGETLLAEESPPPIDAAPLEESASHETPTEADPIPEDPIPEEAIPASRSIGLAPLAITGVSMLGVAVLGVSMLGVTWLLPSPSGAPEAQTAAVSEETREEVDAPALIAVQEAEPLAPRDKPPAPAEEQAGEIQQAASWDEIEPLPAEPPPPAETGTIAVVEEEDIASEAPPEPATPIDPIDFDPESIDLVLRGQDAVGAPSVAVEPPIESRPPEKPSEPDRLAEDLDRRLGEAAGRSGLRVRLVDTGESPASPRGAATLLAMTLPRIDLAGAPLQDLADMIGAISGAPITLEPRELAMAGLEATSPVTMRGEEKTLDELLVETLGSVRLGRRLEGRHVVVTRENAEKQGRVEHKVFDLVRDNGEALLDLVRAVGPSVLRDSAAYDDAGDLAFTASRREHYELLLLCERLRLARGGALTSRYPRRLLRVSPPLETFEDKLDEPATFSFISPTPLTDVVAYLRRALGVAVLVDWRSLEEAGLGPWSRIECAATDRPWRGVLDGVLEPLGAGWAAVDGKTLWITSLDRLAGEEFVEFYRLDAAQADLVAERLALVAPAARVVYDRPSSSLLVRGSAAAQRKAWELCSSGGSNPAESQFGLAE